MTLGKTTDGKDTLTLDDSKWSGANGAYTYDANSDGTADLSIQLKLDNTDGLSETDQMVFILNNTQG